MSRLIRWVLEGARDGRQAFAFFPTRDHTDAFERAMALGWIEPRETTFALTDAGRLRLARKSGGGA